MPTTKAVSSKASIGTALNYIENAEKTDGGKLIDSINCRVSSAQDEFNQVRNYYGKTDGRTYKHYVIAFDPNAEKQPTSKEAMKICKEVIQNTPHLQGFQCVIAVHTDKAHTHAHIIVNSVNVIDGHKLNESKAQLNAMKDIQNEICLSYGYKPPEKNKRNEKTLYVDYDKDRYQAHLKQPSKKELLAKELYDKINELHSQCPHGTNFYKFLEEQTKGKDDINFKYSEKHKYQAFHYQGQTFREKYLIEHYGEYSDSGKQKEIGDKQNDRDRDRSEIDRLIEETERGLAEIERPTIPSPSRQYEPEREEPATSERDKRLEENLNKLYEQAGNRTQRERETAERMAREEQQRREAVEKRIRDFKRKMAREREKEYSRER